MLAPLAPAGSALPPLSQLSVSADGRHFVRADGTPFFWLGDTAWELFHRLSRQEAEAYLEDRRRKGFTVVQAVVLAELGGLRVPNAYGELPLIENDPGRPNEAYFRHVDHVVEQAATKGMYIAMLPTWGDKFNRKWGEGPEIFTPSSARVFGTSLGRRYGGKPVIWILGGDRNPETAEHLAIIRALAAGLRDGGGQAHLIGYHPQGGSKSWEWFHEDVWLDFHMFQSGHERRDLPNHRFTAEARKLVRPKPVVDGEPRYEDHPINWKAELGWFDAFDVRQAAYWSMLAGAAGHTYGDHNIWQMWQPGREPISAARAPWRQALQHEGAAQMGFMRQLFESRLFTKLEPAQDVIAGANPEDGGRQVAARAGDGSYLYAYTPFGRALTIRLSSMQSRRIKATWFDPRSGESETIGNHATSGEQTFVPPGGIRRGNDWVLILEAETASPQAR